MKCKKIIEQMRKIPWVIPLLAGVTNIRVTRGVSTIGAYTISLTQVMPTLTHVENVLSSS